MSYLGNTPEVYQYDAATQKFSGNGSQTVFTLNRRILDVDDVIAVIENVIQEPTAAYTLAANTTSGTADITFTSAPASGTDNIQVRYTAINYNAYNIVTAEQLQANSVTTSKITDGSVTTSKLADSSVTSAKLDPNAVTPPIPNILMLSGM
jgi:hypothetical protein